jgi:hypothetical protein
LPVIPDAAEYGALLQEYPALVGELIAAYPISAIKQLAAAVSEVAAPSYAEQLVFGGFGQSGREADALQLLRAAAEVQPACKGPTSKECRVEHPSQATSGSVPAMPEGWPEHLLAWVQEEQSHWPLNAAHAQQLFAGDEDCENIVRWLQNGVPILHPGHVVPAFDCRNCPVQPSLAAFVEAAAAQELAEHHVACPPAGVHSPYVHATAAVAKGPVDAPTGARRIHDFARPAGGAVKDHVRYLPGLS